MNQDLSNLHILKIIPLYNFYLNRILIFLNILPIVQEFKNNFLGENRMKILIGLSILILSIAAHAGPEEHIQAQTCYYVVAEESSRLNDGVPTEICLETLDVDTSTETISVFSYFNANLFKNLKLTSVSRKNEDTYSFKSVSAIEDSLNQTKLFVNGQVNNYGESDVNFLEIKVEQIVKKINVESPNEINTYKYRAY
jgi:hypothetical protein